MNMNEELVSAIDIAQACFLFILRLFLQDMNQDLLNLFIK